jgi:ATP-dependent DNA helicase 2 subunit 2
MHSSWLTLFSGIDFDDNDFGFKEEDKSSTKRQNETLLKRLTEGCKRGLFATAAEAIEGLSIPDLKTVRPYKTYEEKLALGDPARYPETTMYIDVVRYFKTKPATAVSASSFVTRASTANEDPSVQSSNTLPGDTEMIDAQPVGGDLSAVRSARTYKINDAAAPGGKRDVGYQELEKGYEYGRTAVPISASDEIVTKLETKKSFSIIGFIPNDKVCGKF